jgi:hypothetical protein
VALVFVVVALAAVTWNTPQGHIPWHNVLRGTSNNSILLAVQKHPVPQSHIPSHVVLTGKITPAMRKADPSIPAAALVWQCDFYAYAGQASSDVMWAEGYVLCNESMPISQQIIADRCNPFGWGCIWAQQFYMGSTCNTTYVGQYCPASGAYTRAVQTHYLWRGRALACVTPPGDIQHCISSTREVQF